MNIILLGAPGSGKGTVSEKLISEKSMIQLSTGDLFRKNILENTELGQEAQKYMNEGKYVPNEVTNGMVKDYLKNQNNQNLIFDGFPRTIEQAEALDQMLLELNTQIDKVLLLDVDSKIIYERLVNRIICPVCKRSYHRNTRKPKVQWICDFDGANLVTRPDDDPSKIEIRLKEYENLTAPLIDFYKKQNKLVKVDFGKQISDEAFHEILKEIEN